MVHCRGKQIIDCHKVRTMAAYWGEGKKLWFQREDWGEFSLLGKFNFLTWVWLDTFIIFLILVLFTFLYLSYISSWKCLKYDLSLNITENKNYRMKVTLEVDKCIFTTAEWLEWLLGCVHSFSSSSFLWEFPRESSACWHWNWLQKSLKPVDSSPSVSLFVKDTLSLDLYANHLSCVDLSLLVLFWGNGVPF